MKVPEVSDAELAMCCADFYSHPLLARLLDGIFHPGGLAMSSLLAEKMSISSGWNVLDLACGDGRTASFIAKRHSCQVHGIDASPQLIQQARQRGKSLGVQSVEFKVGLAQSLPFPDAHFDAAYSECALCTFGNKTQSVREVSRVLKSTGIFGLSDIVMCDYDALDDSLKGLLGQVACVAGALSDEGYVNLFEQAGFLSIHHSSHANLLMQMAARAKSNAHMLEVGWDDLTKTSIDDIIAIINKIESEIQSGNLGYDLFVFRKSS